MNEEGLIALFGGLIIFFVLVLIIGIILYILKSIGLYALASKAGIQNSWLAWLPIGDLYIMAKLAKGVTIGSFNVPNLELVFPVGAAIVVVGSAIPFLGTILSIAFAVLFFFVLYKLYVIYRPNQAVLWLVLSILLCFMSPIFIFMMRNDRPVNIV